MLRTRSLVHLSMALFGDSIDDVASARLLANIAEKEKLMRPTTGREYFLKTRAEAVTDGEGAVVGKAVGQKRMKSAIQPGSASYRSSSSIPSKRQRNTISNVWRPD